MIDMKKQGFTLTEMLGVVVIITILIVIAVPIYFNTTKNVKEQEYNSVKNRIESLALRYVQDNNLESGSLMSVNRLISSGYLSADKYIKTEDYEEAFIINPKDPNDNLACHIIEVTQENYEYKVNLTNDSDCAFTSQETVDNNIVINAYEIDVINNVEYVGKLLKMESNNVEYEWTNKDVLLVMYPYQDSNGIKPDSASVSLNGTSREIDIIDSSKNVGGVIGKTIASIKDYTNVEIIRAQVILKTMVSVNAKVGGKLKTKSVRVKIDKEDPIANNETYDGWTSENKKAIVYVSDGNGSGAKGVHLTTVNDISKVSDGNLFTNQSEGAFVVYNKAENKNLDNGQYYIWPVDYAGNVAKNPSILTIKNVSNASTNSTITVNSKEVDYKSNRVRVIISGKNNDIGIKEVCYLIDDSNYEHCTWHDLVGDVYEEDVTLPSPEGSGNTFTIRAFVKDNLGKVSDPDQNNNGKIIIDEYYSNYWTNCLLCNEEDNKIDESKQCKNG